MCYLAQFIYKQPCDWGVQLAITSYIFSEVDSTMKLSQIKKLLQLIRNTGPGWMIKREFCFKAKINW